jgi:hypothetical protein
MKRKIARIVLVFASLLFAGMMLPWCDALDTKVIGPSSLPQNQ